MVEKVTWKEFTTQMDKYQSIERLVSENPNFALGAYRTFGWEKLGREFVNQYSGKSECFLSYVAGKIGRELKGRSSKEYNPKTSKEGIYMAEGVLYVGSTSPDKRSRFDMNWRNSNVWDNGINSLENLAE